MNKQTNSIHNRQCAFWTSWVFRSEHFHVLINGFITTQTALCHCTLSIYHCTFCASLRIKNALLARQSLSHQSAKTIWLSGASTTTGTDTATKPKIHKLKTIWRPLLPYGWTSQCPDVKNYKRPLNPVWHRMLYSCTHMATLRIKVKRQLAWKKWF